MNKKTNFTMDAVFLPELPGHGFDNMLIQKAYRLQFRQEADEGEAQLTELDWVIEENGSGVRYHKEPETSFYQRFSAGYQATQPRRTVTAE